MCNNGLNIFLFGTLVMFVILMIFGVSNDVFVCNKCGVSRGCLFIVFSCCYVVIICCVVCLEISLLINGCGLLF